jgi:hypothetical protein
MSTLRPLPARPSLEFERKEAKALHRLLRAGDAAAVVRARAQHPAIRASDPAHIKLTDAQLVIAREYGFSSWPRLVRYFGDVERQRDAIRGVAHDPAHYESIARYILAEHGNRRPWAARVLAPYVPRFYGQPFEEIFASTIELHEVRLAVARMYGLSSWEVLLERSTEDTRRIQADSWEIDPFHLAHKAISAADVAELQRLADAYPELLEVRDDGGDRRPSLLGSAMSFERRLGVDVLRPIMEWLVAQGFDLQRALNVQLCGRFPGMDPDTVEYLLERGADPNWVAPSGISVLEYALIRYQNGAAVDILARYATPRSALWIAAGLGDVQRLRGFLDRNGRPTAAARRTRPDFVALGYPYPPYPQQPDADDEEVLVEAFMVAMLNDRTAVMDYMLTHGTSANALVLEAPLIHVAVAIQRTAAVECLVRAGADLDIKPRHQQMSARELAREYIEHGSDNPRARRIAELCGLEPDAILATREARPASPPKLHSYFERALELANDDAVRLGQSEVNPENLLFGMLRNRNGGLNVFLRYGGMDVDRLRADVNERMHAADDRIDSGPRLPRNADAQAIVAAAIAAAAERRHNLVTEFYLAYALIRDEQGAAARLVTRYGGHPSKLLAETERAL